MSLVTPSRAMRRRFKIIVALVTLAWVIFFLYRNKKSHPSGTSSFICSRELVSEGPRLLRSEECWGKSLKHRWHRFYNETTCKDNKHRYILKQLLKFWTAFAEKHNITYALMWGTLLGLVRVNDILPWDHDIDVIIDYKDMLKMEQIVKKPGTFDINDGKVHIAVVPNVMLQHNLTNRKRRTCKGKNATRMEDQCSFQEPLSRVLLGWQFIDLFHFYDKGEQLVTIPEGKRFAMNKTDIFPLQKCSIMGLVSLCPKNPSRLLGNWYGKDYLESTYKCNINGLWQDENGNFLEKPFRCKSACILVVILSCLAVLICTIGLGSLWHHSRKNFTFIVKPGSHW